MFKIKTKDLYLTKSNIKALKEFGERMEKNRNPPHLPKKHNTEDTIFNHCVTDIPEFPQYITPYKDIKRRAHTKILSKSYQNLNLDSVFELYVNRLINIEHHSSLTKAILARDCEYLTTLYCATLKSTEQFIMYTEELPIPLTVNLNYRNIYSPNFFITKEIDGQIRLNNLKYKLENNIEITPFDVIDLIWMPTFSMEINKEDLIVEMSVIYSKILLPDQLSHVAKNCITLWAGKYVEDSEKRKIIVEKLKMSAIHIRPLEEELRDAIIDGEIMRAEERGKELGKELGKERIIKTLLEKYSPQEISEMINIDADTIEKINARQQ